MQNTVSFLTFHSTISHVFLVTSENSIIRLTVETKSGGLSLEKRSLFENSIFDSILHISHVFDKKITTEQDNHESQK